MKKLIVAGGLAAALAACSSPEVVEQGSAGTEAQAVQSKGRYIVAFRDVAQGKAALKAAGAEVALDIHGMAASAAYIPEAALNGLRNNPAVEYVEEDAVRKPMSQSTPYGITMVQADQVWPTTRGGGVKVCIIDSGLYTGHEDHQTPYAVSGITGSTPWNTDACGHGTHVAGTIAGIDNTVGVIGVNPGGVPLQIVKVFGDDCSWTYASGLADAINKCADSGAKVINMSLGGSLKSRTEESALNNAYNRGVLSIAAAGNDGNNRLSYPASYTNAVSVAAVDQNKAHASFSQYNSQVDISAPGVGVLSTVGWLDESKATVGGSTYTGTYMDGAARGTATGALVYGGLCAAGSGTTAWAGKVVLCDRGTVNFNEKVQEVQAKGGVAAIIANNVSGGFSGTLGTGNTSTIVAIGVSMEDGAVLQGQQGQSTTVSSIVTKPASGYEAWDGTSMATPHVAGVAALIWSDKPSRTPAQIRAAMEKTAEDLGAAGRDDQFGYGLVRAKAALDYLRTNYP